jgi:hypothetical protein
MEADTERRRVRRALAAAALAALTLVPVAHATDATSGQVAALAARAPTDPAALAQLRQIDRVDGRPVAIGRSLEGASGIELRARLRVLAGGAATGAAPAGPSARTSAEQILSQRRYTGSGAPRPLRGLLGWLGDKLGFVGDPVRWVARHVPGGGALLWVILSLAVIAGAVLLATRTARRRAGSAAERALAAAHAGSADPVRLEREADEAERRGDLEAALRLRFRAGLLRLARAGAIPERSSLTSGEARRLVRLGELDHLAATFDEVVYGGREPRPDDIQQARTEWPRVLERAGKR